jgi:FkbM family methyltransferase
MQASGETLIDGPAAILARLIADLPASRADHVPGTPNYERLRALAREQVAHLFGGTAADTKPFGPFGPLVFPYVGMGAISSLDLFGLDELILFSFYHANRHRYRRALDLGANIGLHSVVLARCGFSVVSYEPDPVHFAQLQRTLAVNSVQAVRAVNAAVSTQAGTMEFVRVLGNTTSSHLAGAKPAPYGKLERFPVRVECFTELLASADLVKMDIEGQEAAVLAATEPAHWLGVDCIAEIGTPENATIVFEHFRHIGINLFAQKCQWRRVERCADMPESYRDGSLFITAAPAMPWGAD